jgi:hypothetical protein
MPVSGSFVHSWDICRRKKAGERLKHAEKDIKRRWDDLTALRDALKKRVKESVEDPEATKLWGSKPLVGQLKQCLLDLNDPKKRLNPTQTWKTRWRLRIGALKWPFTREGCGEGNHDD